MRAGKNKRKRELAESKPASDYSFLELIPDRKSADVALDMYFETLGYAYSVIHKPSFMQTYENFWQQPDKASKGFLVLLVLILASVGVATRETPDHYMGDSSPRRDQAIIMIQACEQWINNHSFKHIVVEVFQARCLLQLAKAMNSVNLKQSWVATERDLHFALSAGLHRDPLIMCDKVSFFDREMRRRIWAAVTELEQTNCIFHGFPSSSAAVHADAAAPANIYDEDMIGDNQRDSRPADRFTPASYLNTSRRSLDLRTELTSLLTSKTEVPYDEIMRYDELVTKALAELPQWKYPTISHTFVRNLLDIQLRQYLLLLHWPVTIRKGDGESRAAFSRTAVVNAAKFIIECHQDLVSAGSYVLCLLRTDIYRAALCILQTYCQAKDLKSQNSGVGTTHDMIYADGRYRRSITV